MQGQGAQLCSHTIQTHGVRLARKHTHDLVVLVLLAALVIALHYAPPFNRFVGKDMMAGIRYPVKPSTVPAWTVPIISILCPWVIFISIYVARRDVYDLHHATLGVLFAVLVTAIFTDVIKTAVGRPRPDFFWRCFPDGKQLYDQVTGDVICHGKKSFSTDGRKSFPSGHTSWSFAGLGFLSLYLSGKMKAFDRQGHVAKLCIVILPLLLASLVGISRVDDYRHHWGDVFVGGLIGFIMALLCYLHFFPPPYHYQGFSIFLSRQIPFSVGDRMHTSTCWRNFERPIQTMHKTNTLQLQVGNTLAYPGRSMTGSQVTIWNLEVGNLPASCA